MHLHQRTQKRCSNPCSKYKRGQKHNSAIQGHCEETERETSEPDSISKGIQQSEALANGDVEPGVEEEGKQGEIHLLGKERNWRDANYVWAP